MPERGFPTERWNSDEWFQDLTRDQRSLWWYLGYNDHCNQAGLYQITLTTISFEAKFSKEELPDLINSLAPKIKWWPDANLIWVKDFIREQSKSSKFLQAAAKSLTSIKNSEAIEELLDYYEKTYSISIPYQYYIDKLLILTRATGTGTNTNTNTSKKGEGVVKGEREQSPGSGLEVEDQQYGDQVLAEISRLYTENIGELPAGGILIEDMIDFANNFRGDLVWIKAAFREAIGLQKRNWRYIQAILERWQMQGGPDGRAQQELRRESEREGGAHPGDTQKSVKPAKKSVRYRE